MISRERPDCQTQTPAESGQAEKWLPDSSGGASKTRRQQGMGGHTRNIVDQRSLRRTTPIPAPTQRGVSWPLGRGRIIWTDQTHTRPFAALMAAEFLVTPGGRDVCNIEEACEWLQETGLRTLEHKALAGPASVIVAAAARS